MSSTQQQFSCLYTKHKTQKRRVWHDGRLVVSGGRAKLFSAEPTSADPLLDECDFSESQPMETERFLIQIEGPWVKPTTLQSGPGPGPSTQLPKILGRKFQPPQRVIPPPHRSRHSDMVLGKRKRPLQPGELEQLHYGSNPTRLGSLSRPSPSPAGPHSWQDRINSTSFHQHGTDVNHSLLPPPPQRQQRQQQYPSPLLPADAADAFGSTERFSQQPASRRNHAPSTIPPEIAGFDVPEAGLTSQPRQLEYAATPIAPAIVPDAFSVHATKTNGQPRPGNLPFVSNNFNESEYYGLEEEEEEENDDAGVKLQTNERTLDQLPNHDSFHPFSTLPHTPATRACPEQLGQADPTPALAQSTKPKSTNELLALFGAVPLVPTIGQESSHPATQTLENDNPGNTAHQDTEQVRFYLPSPTNSESSDQDDT